mmetsp:Transcript_56187/g.133404  ORF Transcript_56187/g.133404 Transcript_56187/m.133404 type:complete len:293 (-) Transcript_56187:2019-2897(-)
MAEDRNDKLPGELDSAVVDQIVQRSMLHQLHDKHRLAVALDHGPHNRSDAGVAQLANMPHLLHEVLAHPIVSRLQNRKPPEDPPMLACHRKRATPGHLHRKRAFRPSRGSGPEPRSRPRTRRQGYGNRPGLRGAFFSFNGGRVHRQPCRPTGRLRGADDPARPWSCRRSYHARPVGGGPVGGRSSVYARGQRPGEDGGVGRGRDAIAGGLDVSGGVSGGVDNGSSGVRGVGGGGGDLKVRANSLRRSPRRIERHRSPHTRRLLYEELIELFVPGLRSAEPEEFDHVLLAAPG